MTLLPRWAIFLLASACGGQIVGGGGNGDGGETNDAVSADSSSSDTTSFPLCPITQVTVDQSCNDPAQVCIYIVGSSCKSFVCQGGTWQSTSAGC
jgi:hypothetical protein